MTENLSTMTIDQGRTNAMSGLSYDLCPPLELELAFCTLKSSKVLYFILKDSGHKTKPRTFSIFLFSYLLLFSSSRFFGFAVLRFFLRTCDFILCESKRRERKPRRRSPLPDMRIGKKERRNRGENGKRKEKKRRLEKERWNEREEWKKRRGIKEKNGTSS